MDADASAAVAVSQIVQSTNSTQSFLTSDEIYNVTNSVLKQKPILYLHIGPHKSGTTTIQTYFEKYYNELAQDSIAFYGKGARQNFKRPLNCRRGYKGQHGLNCVKSLISLLKTENRKGHHFLYSDEFLSSDLLLPWNQHHLQTLADLQQDWDVRIFMGYRPWFEFIFSRYNQIFKPDGKKRLMELWPNQKGIVPPRLVDLWKDDVQHLRWQWNGNNQVWFNPAMMKEAYDEFFKNFTVFDIYDGDMVEHFICDLLEMADNTCHAYREDKSDPKFEMKVKNPAIPMEYDVIAVAASMKLDFFDHKRSREEVRSQVQYYHETEKNRTIADLPMLCPSKTSVQALYNASVSIEKKLFPERDTHERLEKSFLKALKERRLCHLDIDFILGEDEEWIAFFRFLIEGNKSTKINKS